MQDAEPMCDQPGEPSGSTDTRLTVTEVLRCRGEHGAWTELELWYWFHDDLHPRRFRLHVDRHPPVQIGDLVRRDAKQPRYLRWWDNEGHRHAGFLLLISDVEDLPPLGG